MAATIATFHFSNGQILSAYMSANTPGSYVRNSTTGAATSTSPFDFTVISPCCIKDIITDASAVTGAIEFIKADDPGLGGSKVIDLDARFLIGVVNRQKFIKRICFRPGIVYRIRQVVTQA